MADAAPESPEKESPDPAKVPRRLARLIFEIDPRQLVPMAKVGKNARYMTGEQQRRLTSNVVQDGGLTSVPLVYALERTPEQDGLVLSLPLAVISGNHRVEAAIAAGVALIDVFEVLSYLTPAEVTALQLSHNAITGQDDLSILFEMYDSLDLSSKLYSGLTDDAFKLPELDLSGLSLQPPAYQDLHVLFLPAEAAEFQRIVAELQKKPPKGPTLMAQYSDFDRLFEAVCTTKEQMQVFNTAIAFRVMADLALLKLSEMKEADAEKAPEQSPGP